MKLTTTEALKPSFEREFVIVPNQSKFRIGYRPLGYDAFGAFGITVSVEQLCEKMIANYILSYAREANAKGDPFFVAQSYAEAMIDLLAYKAKTESLIASNANYDTIVAELLKLNLDRDLETLSETPRGKIMHIVRLGDDRVVIKGKVYRDEKAVVKFMMEEWGIAKVNWRYPTKAENIYWDYMLKHKFISVRKFKLQRGI